MIVLPLFMFDPIIRKNGMLQESPARRKVMKVES